MVNMGVWAEAVIHLGPVSTFECNFRLRHLWIRLNPK